MADHSFRGRRLEAGLTDVTLGTVVEGEDRTSEGEAQQGRAGANQQEWPQTRSSHDFRARQCMSTSMPRNSWLR